MPISRTFDESRVETVVNLFFKGCPSLLEINYLDSARVGVNGMRRAIHVKRVGRDLWRAVGELRVPSLRV